MHYSSLKNLILNNRRLIVEVLTILIIIGLTIFVNNSNIRESDALLKEDIYYEFHQSLTTITGGNPYNKILEGNLLENKKYATLFPHYYYFLGTIITFSDYRFTPFIANYQHILQLFQILGVTFLYLIFRRRNQKFLGILAITFFVFNRWSLNSIAILKQDIVAITLLLASLYSFDTDKNKSYILYALSLGIKHLGIFICPLYILPIILEKNKRLKIQHSLVFLATLLIPTFPFLLENLKSFCLSMLFSFTRKPASACGVNPSGFDNLLIRYGSLGNTFEMFFLILPRLPLITILSTNIGLFAWNKIGRYQYLLTTFIIFAAVNPVYFDQYLLWITPFVFLIQPADSFSNYRNSHGS